MGDIAIMPDDMMRSDPAQMPNDAPADRSTMEPFGRQVTKDGIETIQTYFDVSQNGHFVETVAPGERIFPGFSNQPASIVAISTHQLKDLYVFLAGYDGSTSATIRIFINPLVSLVWSGGLILVVGGIFCWWPERRRATTRLAPAKPGAGAAQPALATAGKEATR